MRAVDTARLRLTPLRRRSLRELHLLYSDPELMRFITGHPRTPWQTRARLKKDLRHHRVYGFGLCLAHTRAGELVGRCGIESHEGHGRLEGELAWMVRREHSGEGFATEMARAMVDIGLGALGLPCLFATAHVDNRASIRIMEKVGMRLVRTTGAQVEYEILPVSPPPTPE